MDIKEKELYYYSLSKAGSHWGKIIYEVLIQKNGNHNTAEEVKKIFRRRKIYQSKDVEVKEKLRVEILSLPSYLKWLFSPILLSLILVPLYVTVLYLPLHLLKTQTMIKELYLKPTKSFIVTEKFIEEALDNVSLDIGPPSPPTGVTGRIK